MDNLKIGQLITGEQHRDAIHVAVAPMVAGELVGPGWRVGIVDGKAFREQGPNETRKGDKTIEAVGIVDPYLDTGHVRMGQRFWLFLFPGSVTSLRHEWTHPAFVDAKPAVPASITAAHDRIAELAEGIGLSVDELMEGAADYAEREDHTYMGENERYKDFTHERWQQFWDDYEAVTGKKGKREDGHFFSCSC